MKTTIRLESTSCGCCFSSAYKEIGKVTGIFGVSIDAQNSTITIEHTDEVTKEAIIKKLQEIGYHPVN